QQNTGGRAVRCPTRRGTDARGNGHRALMRIALAVSDASRVSWSDRLAASPVIQALSASIVPCSLSADLVAADPDVVVAHESDAVIEFLRGAPRSLKLVQFLSAGID